MSNEDAPNEETCEFQPEKYEHDYVPMNARDPRRYCFVCGIPEPEEPND